MRALFPSTMDVLEKNLQLRQDRHQVLSSNIANAETPGYIAKDVQFEQALRAAARPSQQTPLSRTHPHHIPRSMPNVHDVRGTVIITPSDDVGNDLNTVSVDQEMARLTINVFQYNASTEILSRMLTSLRHTVSEGR